MMSYPLEKDKGKAFSIFWTVFQLGTFVGSVIALSINLKSGKLTAVATSTYLVSNISIYILITLDLEEATLNFLFLGLPRDNFHRDRLLLPRPRPEPCHPCRRLSR